MQIDLRQRHKAIWFVDVEALMVVALFQQNAIAVPDKVGSAECILLGDAPPKGGVVVAEALCAAVAGDGGLNRWIRFVFFNLLPDNFVWRAKS